MINTVFSKVQFDKGSDTRTLPVDPQYLSCISLIWSVKELVGLGTLIEKSMLSGQSGNSVRLMEFAESGYAVLRFPL